MTGNAISLNHQQTVNIAGVASFAQVTRHLKKGKKKSCVFTHVATMQLFPCTCDATKTYLANKVQEPN